MATLTLIDRERMNPREANILEEARLRKVAIQNMQRDNLEAKSIWRDKQMKSYGNLVTITEATPLSKVITEEIQARSQDEFLQRQHAIANISMLADQVSTEYIIDRLNYEQMRWMNDNWEGIIRNIQKKSSRMDKNVFVNTIIAGQASGESYDDTFAGRPTNAMTRSADLKTAQAQAVAQRLADQYQREQDQQVRDEQAGLDLNAKRDSEREALRLARIAQITAQNQASRVQNQVKSFLAKKALAPVPAPVSTPPRSVSPSISASAQMAINSSKLKAQLQAIADKKIQNSAGGNAVKPSILTPVVSTVGNAVLAGGAPASPRPSSPITTMVLSPGIPPPPLARQKSHEITHDVIGSIMGVSYVSTAEATDQKGELDAINKEVASLTKAQIQRNIRKLFTPYEINDITDKLKQISGGKYLKEQTYRDIYYFGRINQMRSSTTGTGIRRKRIIRGRGYTKHQHPKIQPRRHYINDSYYVDLNKLDDNVLCVKYAQNDSVLPHLKPQTITTKTKEMISDILNSKYDDRIFKLLISDEKRDVKKFCKCVRLDMNISDDEEKEF